MIHSIMSVADLTFSPDHPGGLRCVFARVVAYGRRPAPPLARAPGHAGAQRGAPRTEPASTEADNSDPARARCGSQPHAAHAPIAAAQALADRLVAQPRDLRDAVHHRAACLGVYITSTSCWRSMRYPHRLPRGCCCPTPCQLRLFRRRREEVHRAVPRRDRADGARHQIGPADSETFMSSWRRDPGSRRHGVPARLRPDPPRPADRRRFGKAPSGSTPRGQVPGRRLLGAEGDRRQPRGDARESRDRAPAPAADEAQGRAMASEARASAAIVGSLPFLTGALLGIDNLALHQMLVATNLGNMLAGAAFALTAGIDDAEDGEVRDLT